MKVRRVVPLQNCPPLAVILSQRRDALLCVGALAGLRQGRESVGSAAVEWADLEQLFHCDEAQKHEGIFTRVAMVHLDLINILQLKVEIHWQAHLLYVVDTDGA